MFERLDRVISCNGLCLERHSFCRLGMVDFCCDVGASGFHGAQYSGVDWAVVCQFSQHLEAHRFELRTRRRGICSDLADAALELYRERAQRSARSSRFAHLQHRF